METVYNIANRYTIQIGLVVLCYIIASIAVLLDLRSGIAKAKQRGEYRSSFKFRKTCQKFNEYGNTLLILTIVDVLIMVFEDVLTMQMHWTLPNIPIFTFLGAIGVCYIEYKSIREKAEDKHKFEEAEAFLINLAKEKNVLELLQKLKEQKNDTPRIKE